MTAYGRAEYHIGDTTFVAEIKSLNNRYRDIILRIPNNFQVFEEEIRSIIASKIRRGRIELSIQMENSSKEVPYNFELNVSMVKSYFNIFKQLGEQFGLEQDIRMDTLCQMKDVILVKPLEIDLEGVRPGFHEAVKQALDSLDEMKIKEGKTIETDFVKRLELLEHRLDEVNKRSSNLVEEYGKRLKEKINRLLVDVAVDESRLAQEVAFLADKTDITEEVVRIGSHLKQFAEYLSMDDALGRRLDFLIQEINREVNTLSAKSSDSVISKLVVETKADLEKLREQVQNVE